MVCFMFCRFCGEINKICGLINNLFNHHMSSKIVNLNLYYKKQLKKKILVQNYDDVGHVALYHWM